MQIAGTVIIFMLFVISYFYFVKVKEKENYDNRELSRKFYLQLEEMAKEKKDFKIVLAGGDNNSEVSIVDAIERISMSKDIRIK